MNARRRKRREVDPDRALSGVFTGLGHHTADVFDGARFRQPVFKADNSPLRQAPERRQPGRGALVVEGLLELARAAVMVKRNLPRPGVVDGAACRRGSLTPSISMRRRSSLSVQHGWRAGQVQRPAHRRAARRRPEHGPGGPAGRCRSCSWRPARSRPPSRPARSRGRAGRRALPPQRRAQAGGQSCRVGGLAEEYRAGVADQAGPAAGDLQGMGPLVMLHGEERSSPRNTCVWKPVISQTRALFARQSNTKPSSQSQASHQTV